MYSFICFLKLDKLIQKQQQTMNYKMIFSVLLLFSLMFSCSPTEPGYEHEPVDKYRSEIFLIDLSKGTNEFLGLGWKPQFNSQNNVIIFIEKNPYEQIERRVASFNLQGQEEYQLTEYYQYLREIEISAATGKIIFSSWDFTYLEYDIYLVNEEGSDFLNLTHTVDVDEYTPSFSENGQKVCFEQYDRQNNFNQLVLMDLSGEKKILKTFEINSPKNSTFALNDTKIIFSEEVPLADGEKTVLLLDLNNPEQIDTLKNMPPTIFTTNDTKVIYNEGYKTIKSFDLLTKEETVIGEGFLRAISQNGNRIVFSDKSHNQTYYLIMMTDNGSTLDTLVVDETDYTINSIDYFPSFSKDNTKIVYSKEIWYRE